MGQLLERLEMARRMGADAVIDASKQDPVQEIRRLTGGRGVDAAIEALGRQATFEAALCVLCRAARSACAGSWP